MILFYWIYLKVVYINGGECGGVGFFEVIICLILLF